jgi:hypothetical protein
MKLASHDVEGKRETGNFEDETAVDESRYRYFWLDRAIENSTTP